VAGQGVAAGRLTPGELIAATGYVPIALGLFDHVSNLGSLAVDRACAVRVAEVLACPTAPVGTSRLGPGRGVLALRGVGVALDGRRLLGPLDLDVAGGTTVAIVGHSGAGKSILALVAGGLWTPDEGSVELDGVALGDLTPADRAGAVAFAFDVPHLVGRTIADALAYGHPATRVELYRSLDQAQATAFVERLPGGLDATLATAPFSGGEHQRLGLARALLRRPRLLVLDDATSSLDTVTEALVQDTITGAAAQSTTLVVAHRVSSAARADRVVWVEGTTVRRTGTHRELWADADYRALFAADEAEPVVLGRPA
jgi:ATP-binding cassette subfamily B protein